jgi:site-specific DNA recombinase
MIEQARAAGYVRVSTDEQAERGHSLPEQERLIRECVAEREGWELLNVFKDPGYSGSREDRPGLQDMLARLDEIDVVVVWAMDRLTRDVELFAKLVKRLNAANVRVESLTAHVDLTTPEGEAMAGVAAVFGQFERKRIAERVRTALGARARKGQFAGGPPPDGWMDVVAGHDDKGKPIHERVHHLERASVIRRLFELAEEGLPDAHIARLLNLDGHRTRADIPWTRRAVQNNVTNAWHAGRVMHHRGKPDEQTFAGAHEPLVDPEAFDRIQAMRTARDRAPGARRTGRPNTNHALARLATCAHCGGRMGAFTSSYRRKSDGGRRRFYRCLQAHDGSGVCDAIQPIDAQVVDAAVIAGLDTLGVDFDAWAERIRDDHGDERARLEAELERAERAFSEQTRRADKVSGRWADMVAADDPNADVALPAVEREQQAVRDAQALLAAARDALESVPSGHPTDGMLDFAMALQAAVRGAVAPNVPLVEVNAALRSLFSEFRIRDDPGHGPFHGIFIEPWLLADAVPHGGDWPKLVNGPPPVSTLTPPAGNGNTSHL